VHRLKFLSFFLCFLPSSSQASQLGVSLASDNPLLNRSNTGFLVQTATADFDGDHRSDLATVRREGQSYRVEIQFATGRNPAFVVVPDLNVGTRIFALDIDCDSDQDLVVASAVPSFPTVVWLNNDGGHFEEGRRLWWVTLLTNYNSSSFSSDNSRTQPIFLGEHQRSLFQFFAATQIPTRLVRETLPWESQAIFLRIIPSGSCTRGPPRLSRD